MASHKAARHMIGITLAVVAGVLQAVIASSPTNDDFLHVVLARQILSSEGRRLRNIVRQILGGDWPVRDFFDLGTWLTYGISAASQLIFGHRLLAEAVVVGVMLAVSTYLVFRLVHELQVRRQAIRGETPADLGSAECLVSEVVLVTRAQRPLEDPRPTLDRAGDVQQLLASLPLEPAPQLVRASYERHI